MPGETDSTEQSDGYSVQIGVDKQLGAELKVSPDESESGIAVVEHTLPPKKLAAPLHRHSREDEISYILEGKMSVLEGETVSTVEEGEFAVKNRGLWHTFWNPGPEPLRFLEIIAPGEFAWYFKEIAELLPEAGRRDEETKDRLEALGEKYEFESDLESIPALKAEYGLRE